MRRSRRSVLGAGLLALALFAAACGDSGEGGDGANCADDAERGDVTVGVSGAFAESQIVAEMYAQVLESCGYTVERRLNIDTRQISSGALESGDIDIKPEYVAFELVFQDPEDDGKGTVEEVTQRLRDVLEPKDIAVLEPSAANDTNAFVVTQETADEFSLATMSDLAEVDDQLTLGAPAECTENFFCAVGLKDVYGIEFASIEALDACGPLSAEALAAGEIDVALLCSTQAVIAEEGWVALEDDQGLQQAGNIVPLVRREVLNDEVENLLNSISAALTTENITELNSRVELENEDPADVAGDFLTEEGLV